MADYVGHSGAGLANTNQNDALKILDKFSGIKEGRRIKPLDRFDNVFYNHRYMYSEYNLLIGDTYFMIPPEFIMVTSESQSNDIIALRQENSQKQKSGYHKRNVIIELVFNGNEQINGYPVDGPEGTYYVDGLRQLLAQFKCTPFLPISNELINGMYGIFTVALQGINISTVSGYPNVMQAQISLQEVSMVPYIEMPDAYFQYMIDWDLFRFYYQSFLTEKHEYKKLQSLPLNKEYNHFKISILDESVLSSSEASKYNMLELITDTKVLNGDSNYVTWLDSNESDVTISEFQCAYSNLLTNIQMSNIGCPTVQFLGGMDTVYNITFETMDYSVVQAIEQCQISNDSLTRNNIKLHSVGFVKLESELVEFTGSLFVMVNSVTTNTVPGFPGLYNVQIQCVAYDIIQSEREELSGFLPFENENDGKNQIISQSFNGLKTKIKQDNYAEWKLRTSIEVYPDLRLPTYKEVNDVIEKINTFRKNNNLTELPYNIYPTEPVTLLHGLNPKNTVSMKSNSDGLYDTSTMQSTNGDEYNIFVDPDFYVFYPDSYESFLDIDENYYNNYSPKQQSSYSTKKVITHYPTFSEIDDEEEDFDLNNYSGSDLVEQYISLAKTFIGHTYKWGAAGNVSDSKGKCFDCSGFVTYLLKEIGVMPSNRGRLTVSSIVKGGGKLFKQIPWEQRQRGDCLCNSNASHVVICEGNGKIIHAANKSPYPKGGVKESNEYFTGTCWRPIAFIEASNNNTVSSGTVSSVGSKNNIVITTQFLNMVKQWEGYLSKATSADGGIDIGYGFHNQYYDGTKWVKIKYGMTMTKAQADKCLQYEFEQTWIPVVLRKLGQNGWDYRDFSNNQILALASYFYNRGAYNSSADKLLKKSNSPTIDAIGNNLPNYWGSKASAKKGLVNRRNKEKALFFSGDTGTTTQSTTSENTLTNAEFESICRTIMGETQGESSDAEKAMAQIIYDRLTCSDKRFGGLANILNGGDKQFKNSWTGTLNSTVQENVKKVFCDNDKYWPNKTALYFLTPEDTNATFKKRDTDWDRLGNIDKHTYWGKNTKGSGVKFTISDDEGIGNASSNNSTSEITLSFEEFTVDPEAFGEPIFTRTEDFRYISSNGKKDDRDRALGQNYSHVFHTAFCDDVQYSKKGRLVRAFPAYLFCILDDQSQWYRGDKLWTNYYTHHNVIDIAVHETNDMPISTATITVGNMYHNLDKTQGGLDNYSIANDSAYGSLAQWWYKNTGMIFGLGVKLTPTLIELHSQIYNHARVREGARVHIRMGYGSDPLGLAPMINGHISDITLGDQLSIIVTSDGHELVQHITSSQEKDVNNGFLGLFGLGAVQESSNIIASILCVRQSWANHLFAGNFEASKYSIEHFGLYFHQGIFDLSFSDAFNGYQEQYDILKNIYKANYKCEHMIYSSKFGMDGEQNVVFNKYNMTPWDIFQVATQQVPEYIVKPSIHQFDSRLFFGCPLYLERYRYDYIGEEIVEEMKTAAQIHAVDSIGNIIDNQVRVTGRYTNTNVKVMYTLGSKSVSTGVIHSDDTIDMGYQKTTILDTPITQDALGPDAIYEFLGYKVGEDSARRTGISNLLYGWQQEYQGELILTGHPGMKAHDYLMVDDSFASLYGICIAREVIHSFSTATGFTTSVIPGMIGYSTDQNSGMIQTVNNYLMLLNCFSNYHLQKKLLIDNYERNLNVIAELENAKNEIISRANRHVAINDTAFQVNMATHVGTALHVAIACKTVLKSCKDAKLVTKAIKGVSNVIKGAKTAKNILGAIKAGTTAVSTAVAPGIGTIIAAIVWVAIDMLLDSFFDWLDNKNVCVLLPMWWEGYPFVTNVKDGEKILLMDSNSNATEEAEK